MITPREYAEDFARIWRLEFPADMGKYREAENHLQRAGLKVYGGATEHLIRRS